MEARLVPLAAKSFVPIVVLEGFGRRPIGAACHKLLLSLERRDVAVNAEKWNLLTGVKPEIFFPAAVPSTVTPVPEIITFEKNQKVRIVRPPYAGETGVVQEIKGITAFPGGLRARAALINGGTITPLVNLKY
jgi:hypothetical protein